MSKQDLTLKERYDAIQKIGLEIKRPWHVQRFTTSLPISIFGDQILIGDGDSDYGTLAECREATAWLVEQLGGKVKWQK